MGRLKNWIEAGKQDIFARNRLADDARRWQRRQQDDASGAEEELLSGTRLAQALDMRARGDFAAVVGGLGETETKFLDASAALRDRRRQEEQERQQRELAQAQALAAEQKKRAEEAEKHANEQRESANKLRRRAFVATGAALVALIFSSYHFSCGELQMTSVLQPKSKRGSRRADVLLVSLPLRLPNILNVVCYSP